MSSDFHEILNNISDQVNSDNAVEVKANLRKLGSLFDDTIAKLQVFGSENKEKRSAMATLEKTNAELNEKIESLNKQVTSLDQTELKEQISKLEKQAETFTEKARTELQKKLQKFAKHQNWDKAKDYFEITQGDDGDFDLKDLTMDQLTKHSSELKKLEHLGVLNGSIEPDKPKAQTFSATSTRVEPKTDLGVDDLKDKDKVTEFISQELQKDMSQYVPPAPDDA